ncbi:hypothetical protein KKC97_12945 [bacterium]|nr:hypothetical protein [bacterium]MBU1638564.1 hypothetical protein [bacterium]MBU1920088.1 hypothetical protein [bacterium]
MTRWIFAAAAILMLSASMSFGQGFVVTFYYYSADGPPLTTECDGSTPLPDGRIVRIFADADYDGPDPEDPQPTLCADPPDNCAQGTVNIDQFTTNGVSVSLGAGYFASSPTLVSYGGLPPYFFYYLRIYEADGTTVLWTTDTFLLSTSGPIAIFLTEEDWTCGQGGIQCLVVDETE